MGWAADKVYGVFYNLMKGFFFAIDNIVYGCIPTLYRLLLYLANVDLVTNNVPVEAFIRRIYIFVGVFMLFRLGISMITYIANPESFSDQTKGFTNMVKRVMIALVLLVSVPWLFKEAYVIQGKIIESNVLPALILGETRSNPNSLEESIETSAKDLQFLLFEPFFALNYKAKTTYLPGVKDNGSTSNDLVVCAPDAKTAPSLHIIGSNDMALNKNDCLEKFAELIDEESTVKVAGVTLDDFFRTTDANGVDNPDRRDFEAFGGLLSWKLSNGASGINYIPIISTICGGYVVLLLLTFCIDVAARVIRLLFLQILSPVAIISSIDPTSTGDRLREWGTECLKVWASLFLRLLVIFLLIQLTRVISNTIYSDNLVSDGAIPLSGANGITPWLYLFLILGIFTAIKKIPDLIEKATGIKMDGDLQLNSLKSKGTNFVAGAALGGALGAVSGTFGGMMTSIGLGKNPVAGALSGLGSGMVRGTYGGMRSLDIGKSLSNAVKVGGRVSNAQQVRAETGGLLGIPSMLVDRALYTMGAPTTFQTKDSRLKRYKAIDERMKDVESAADEEMRKAWVDTGNAAQFRANEEELRRIETQFATSGSADGSMFGMGAISSADDMAKLRKIYNDQQTQIREEFIDLVTDERTDSYNPEIGAKRRAVDKASADAGLGRGATQDKKWHEIASPTGYDSNQNETIRKQAKKRAAEIEFSQSYDDARDRNEVLGNTAQRAHINDKH